MEVFAGDEIIIPSYTPHAMTAKSSKVILLYFFEENFQNIKYNWTRKAIKMKQPVDIPKNKKDLLSKYFDNTIEFIT